MSLIDRLLNIAQGVIGYHSSYLNRQTQHSSLYIECQRTVSAHNHSAGSAHRQPPKAQCSTPTCRIVHIPSFRHRHRLGSWRYVQLSDMPTPFAKVFHCIQMTTLGPFRLLHPLLKYGVPPLDTVTLVGCRWKRVLKRCRSLRRERWRWTPWLSIATPSPP